LEYYRRKVARPTAVKTLEEVFRAGNPAADRRESATSIFGNWTGEYDRVPFASMSITRLFKKDWIELARDDDTGAHFLSVRCGGTAMVERRVRLTPEELSLVARDELAYLEKLAADISHEPERFKDRFVSIA
jgi:hypothetical protein